MTEKRFTLHINWFNTEKTKGEALLKDNGQPLLQTENIEDARLLKNILNDLSEENEELKKEVKQLKNKIKTYNNTHELLKKTIDRLRSDG